MSHLLKVSVSPTGPQERYSCKSFSVTKNEIKNVRLGSWFHSTLYFCMRSFLPFTLLLPSDTVMSGYFNFSCEGNDEGDESLRSRGRTGIYWNKEPRRPTVHSNGCLRSTREDYDLECWTVENNRRLVSCIGSAVPVRQHTQT